jgi:IS5 family transposase
VLFFSPFFVSLWSKKWQIMLGKLQNKEQFEFFRVRLEDMINLNHELVLLANTIDWNYFKKKIKAY